MRLLLLILMIALLPLRSWAAVGEPTEAHSATVTAINKIAIQANSNYPKSSIDQDEASTHHACHTSVQTTPNVLAADSLKDLAQPSVPCLSCDDCALCHTLAAMSALSLSDAPLAFNWLRPTGSDRFHSALSALSLKPPIS